MITRIFHTAITVACISTIVESASQPARLRRRDISQSVHSPVSPWLLAEYEVRGGSRAGPGDYVAHGLGATMSMVAKEYGLRDSESFYWGLDGMPMANITAYVDGKDVRVLSLERFDDVLQDAKCTANSIELTFAQEVQFDQIQAGWAWIDEAEANYVVLVTDTARCNIQDGDATVRQPWHVTHADFDDDTNVVTLTAEPNTWNEAFSHWHLEYDSRGLIPGHSTTFRRSLRSRASGEATIDLNQSIPPGQEFSAFGYSITCDDCSTSGGIDFRIANADFALPGGLTGDFEVTAHDLSAHVELTAQIPAGAGPSGELAIPLSLNKLASNAAKLIIPELNLQLGPSITFGVMASVTTVDPVDIKTGLDWRLTDPDATYTIHFHNLVADNPTGVSTWTSETTPLPFTFSKNITLEGSIGTFIDVSLDGDVEFAGTGFGLGAGIRLAAPTLFLDATLNSDQDSCDGVELELGIGAAVFAHEDAELQIGGVGPQTALTQTIFATSTSLTSTCVGVSSVPIPINRGPSGTGHYPLPTGGGAPYGNSTTYPYGTATCPINGALVCRDDRHFGLCNFGRVIFQPVALGTGCYAGRIVGTGIFAVPTPAPTSGSGLCVNGALYCNADGTQYALCNWGSLVFQDVAQGTVCQAGEIMGSGIYAVPPVPTAAPTMPS